METLKDMLIRHEGIKFKPYKCSAGRWTIGVGRNLSDKGITEEEALYLLNNDIDECKRHLANVIFKGQFYEFPENVQLVLLDMRFNLGQAGFGKFHRMIQAFKDKNYKEAITQMKKSKWYEQVTNRADELIEMIRGEINGK